MHAKQSHRLRGVRSSNLTQNFCGVTPRLSRAQHAWQVSGTFRIVAKPLIQEIPVVAGMIVALKAPPEVCDPRCLQNSVSIYRDIVTAEPATLSCPAASMR